MTAMKTTMTPFIVSPTGIITDATFYASPHYDERPPSMPIEMIVMHGISLPPGEYGSRHIIDLFCGRLDPAQHPYFKTISHLRVSAHLLIRRDGALLQFVPLAMRAWHAGVSAFDGRQQCNDFSIGIELEGTDDEAYTDDQYATLLQLLPNLMSAYPIKKEFVVGHSDIAPGRKTDPGPYFNWKLVKGCLR